MQKLKDKEISQDITGGIRTEVKGQGDKSRHYWRD